MKLTDKRFGIFEFMMLLCGILTTCIEALNYGISLFDLMGHRWYSLYAFAWEE